MKKIATVGLILGTALCLAASAQSPSTAVQHAISFEQCRGDVRLWHSQSKDENFKLSFNEIQQRALEMWNCGSIDAGASEGFEQFKTDTENYHLMFTGYDSLMAQRLLHYIERHSETNQFLEEDSKGLR